MIPYTSCVCFDGRTKMKRWILMKTGGQRRPGVVIDRTENFFCIRVLDQKEEELENSERKPNNLSSSEYCLLECLSDTDRNLTPGPFLTPQRRRARIPVSKPQLARLPELDDAYNGIVEGLLSNCDRWNFNTFNLDVASGGRSLPILLVHLFHQYGLVENFHLDASRIWHCFNLIEAGYHSSNPYHNSVHATDVTQAMHCFLQENKIMEHLTPLEAMASLIASVTHDVDHPGVNQPFLIATSNHLASLYKNFSVLENHHWRTAISCLKESRIFDHLDRESWDDMECQIRSLILATDITRQQEFLCRFKRYIDTGILDMKDKEYRHFILQIGLKCADLCNPCRPWEISRRWSYQVCQEFYRQGDYERQLNLPVTPLCDRTKTTVAKIQADFFKFVVTPLFDIWHRFLDTSLSQQLLDNLIHNHSEWREVVDKEEEANAKMQTNELDGCSTADEEELDEVGEQIGSRTDESFMSGEEDSPSVTWGRRHSMPLSVSKMLPRTTIRRQSFPKVLRSPIIPMNDGEEFGSYPLHRSPHISLRTLSAEHLQPKSTIMSLSRSAKISLLRKMDIAAEVERRLVHQPISYPPYIMHAKTEITSTASPEVSAQVSSSSDGRQTDIQETSCSSNEKKEPDLKTTCQDGCCGSSDGECSHGSDGRQSVSNSYSSALDHQSLSCIADSLEGNISGVIPHSNSESSSFVNKGYLSSLEKPRKLVRLKSDSDMLGVESNLITTESEKVQEKTNTTDFEQNITSWCSHISRSLSAERSEPRSHDFDSPASWNSSVNNMSSTGLLRRRGSAPVALRTGQLAGDIMETRGGLRGGTTTVSFDHRWSVPTKPASETITEPELVDTSSTVPSPLGHRPLQKELVRRHSFGLLEPFLSIQSSGSECDGSSTEPTSTGTTCSTRRSSTVPGDLQRKSFSSRGTVYTESNDAEESSSECHDMFYPCFPPNRTPLNKRRGSLPTDIPISLMRRVVPQVASTTAGSRLPSRPSFEEPLKRDCGTDTKILSIPWEHTRRRSSGGEILCALIGSARTLATLQGIAAASVDSVPSYTTAQTSTHVLPRRGSGGLELLSGFWRSRTTDISSDPLPSMGRFKLPRQSYSLDSSCCPEWLFRGSRSEQQICTNVSKPSINQGCTSGISAIEERFLCQPRRGSVPLEMSLFSLLAGQTAYREDGN